MPTRTEKKHLTVGDLVDLLLKEDRDMPICGYNAQEDCGMLSEVGEYMSEEGCYRMPSGIKYLMFHFDGKMDKPNKETS